nr:ribonuclease H-like domain-containing protein [Tanacetum cinerariifolium]
MTNLGALNLFLGIFATRHFTGLFLSQKQYAIELLAHAHMTDYNPLRTPVDTNSKLGPKVVSVQDPTLYRSLVGGLQYLTFTRRDISYAVRHIFLYMHDPREPHHAALKRILCYIQRTMDFEFHLYSSTTISLVGYTDADWTGCPSTRRFTLAETAWLHNLLRELHSPLSAATLVYCDNVSATYLSANLVQHQRTKHIEIDKYFVCDLVTAGQAWNAIRPRGNQVEWSQVVWSSHNIPRHAVYLLLVMRNGLKMHDKMRPWDVGVNTDLPFVDNQPNSHRHLFFECPFFLKVWSYVRDLAGMDLVSLILHDIIMYLQPMENKRMARSVFGKLILAASAYYIWME